MYIVCVTSDPVGDGEYACLKIDAKLATELLRYRAIFQEVKAKDAGLHCLEYWDSAPDFGSALAYLKGDSQVLYDSQWVEVHMHVLVDEASTTAESLRVKDDGVLWTVYHKHEDWPAPFETKTLTWECLQAIADGRHPFPIDGENEI